MTMSTHIDHQSHRLGRRWSRHVIDKVAELWAAHVPVNIIAKRLVANGIVITSIQIYNIRKHHYFPSRGHKTEVIMQIRKLWEDGYSLGRIARSLNLRRNQVIGIVNSRGFERKTDQRFTLRDLDEE